jgi:trehalose synthase
VLPTVPVTPKRVDDYVEPAGPEAVERLRDAAKALQGARLLQVNSTAFGGGVAELLHTHVPLLQDLGIDTTWALIEGHEEFYALTKGIHNALQGAPLDWGPGHEAVYWERIRANARELVELAEPFDYVLIHDPQPAGLLQALEELGGRHGRWLWRCHVDLSTPNATVWAFFEPLVRSHDAVIFTLDEYRQPGLVGPHIASIPPSIDPLSPKNVELSGETIQEIVVRYGIDPARPLMTQISRFDPWKDPIGVIDAFFLARMEVPDLQLLMAGSLAHDDPEGMHFLDLTEARRDGHPDVHLLTDLQGVGNVEINAFQRASTVVVQKSIREGFGLVVTEAMWKGQPVVGGDVGGIRLQITEGETGYLVSSVEACAQRVVDLIRRPELRARMGRAARERVRERFLCIRELEDTLRLMASLG